MRILITNDDGIMAPGLQVLHDLAIQLAGPEGEVWTVAPQSEQSGVGHCISYTKPVLVHQYAARKFAVEGSPADCILAGLEQDFLELYMAFGGADLCITNPPWDRKLLHPFIEGWMQMCPTWLLFDADWMHTKQSAILMSYCVKVVSVGRVKWIEGSKSVGKDNCCWYLFDALDDTPTEFYGRVM